MKFIKSIPFLLSLFFMLQFNAYGVKAKSEYPFPEAEKYINKLLEAKVPYNRQVLNGEWMVKDHYSYPPGRLAAMFAAYLIDNHLIEDKIIADIGSSGFAVGMLAAKNGAKEVVGVSITKEAARNAKENIIVNDVSSVAHIVEGSGAQSLLTKCKGRVDVIISGPPWNTISSEDFAKIEKSRQPLAALFYDIDDRVVTDVISKGPLLLATGGKIYMTASRKSIDRIKRISAEHNMNCKIVKEEDLHKDENIHYILMLTPQNK